VPNTVGGLYFDESGNSGLWVATSNVAAGWYPFGSVDIAVGRGLVLIADPSNTVGITLTTDGNDGILIDDFAGAGISVNSNGAPIELATTNGSLEVQVNGTSTVSEVFFPQQAPNASPPTYVLGGMYFDTTLNKLRIGGATDWETVTSV
jgi:hypothetical protein